MEIVNKEINSKIFELWEKYYKNDSEVYAPLFYNEFAKHGLLFVGMNPSFSARAFKTIFKDSEYENIDPTSFFKWSNISKDIDLVNQCAKMDKLAYDNYSLYFGRPIEMAKKINLPWDHIDLFLYRETSQSSFMERIRDKNGLNQFALDQLEIFKDTIKAVEPKCIIVSNAFGSEIVREQFADQLTWDSERGFHWLSLNGGKVPIFFSSMLSGQRSLDRWSYERLLWHVGRAVK